MRGIYSYVRTINLRFFLNREMYKILKPLELFIIGKKISEEKTKEILLCTDPYLSAIPPEDSHEFLKIYGKMAGLTNEESMYSVKYAVNTQLLRCLENMWSYGCSIEGCYGWLYPDGNIFMRRDIRVSNPMQTLLDEVKILSEKFPFLEMIVALFSDSCREDDTFPIVCLEVKNGKYIFRDFPKNIPHPRLELSVEELLLSLSDVIPCALSENFLYSLALYVRELL